MAYLIETRGLTKVFGSFTANDKVDFYCEKGTVTALLGENGAGKSTLMKTIYGMQKPDGGDIYFEGSQISLKSPKDAIKLGIQMVHQHFMLVDQLTVAENIVMGEEPRRYGLFQNKKAQEIVADLAKTYGLQVDPTQKVSELTVGAKQRTEIIKALYHGAKLLILDEPTAVLTPQETRELFRIIERLKEDGKTIIIITHKLQESMEIADHIFVLRHGKMVGRVNQEDANQDMITKMMVNHELKTFVKIKPQLNDTALLIEGLNYTNQDGAHILKNTRLTVRGGEIYGVAGIEGNGQRELVEIIGGIIKGWSGKVEILGEDIKNKKTKELIEMGLSIVHSDRMERGLLLDLDARLNVMLGYQDTSYVKNNSYVIDYKKVESMTTEIYEKFDVRPANQKALSGSLSGGNQQKIIVGREFYRKPKLAVIAYPTRGVDIGVSETIHKSILDLKKNGSAVLLITADFDELFKLSDRIGVIYEGSFVTEGNADEYDPNRLGLYMGGGTEE